MKRNYRSTEPFFFSGGELGVLLLHGLSGSPAEMYGLGKEISQHGWTVLGLCLSGHGTDSERFAKAGRKEWLKDAEAGTARLKEGCTGLIGVGLSMGGLLALLLAGKGILDGLVTMNTPLMMAGTVTDHKAEELAETIQEAQAIIPYLTVPSLLMQSRKDRVIDPANVVKIQEGMKQARTEVVYFEKSGHVLTLGPERTEVASRTAEFIRRVETERKASAKY